MLGIEDAEHEESAPGALTLLVSKLASSLAGKTQKIKILPGSLVHRTYGRDEVSEQFACNYGLNPQFQNKIEKGKLKITGVDLNRCPCCADGTMILVGNLPALPSGPRWDSS